MTSPSNLVQFGATEWTAALLERYTLVIFREKELEEENSEVSRACKFGRTWIKLLDSINTFPIML